MVFSVLPAALTFTTYYFSEEYQDFERLVWGESSTEHKINQLIN